MLTTGGNTPRLRVFILALAGAASGGLSLPATAAELKPLRSVIEAEASEATISYMSQRCSAVFLATSQQLRDDGGQTYEDLSAAYEESAKSFFSAASSLSTLPADALARNVYDMEKLYREEMRRSYLTSGNRYEGLVADDITLCSSFSNDS